MLSFNDSRIDDLGVGVFVVRGALNKSSCHRIAAKIDRKRWVQAASGVFEDNKLVKLIYSSKRNVFSLMNVSQQIPELQFNDLEFERLVRPISVKFNVLVSTFTDIGCSVYLTGGSVDLHQDTGFANTNRVITYVVYLNDDFRGGKLLFPNLGISCSPKSGDLVVFLSELRHSVLPVTEGRRMCLVWFGEANPTSRLPLSA